MKSKKTFIRALLILAALVLLVGTLFNSTSFFSSPREDGEVSSSGSPDASADVFSPDFGSDMDSRRERSEKLMSYTSVKGEKIRLAMDKAVLRDEDGLDEIVAISPPATPVTLASRLEEFKAPKGVYPVAFTDEAGEDAGYDTMRVITPEIMVEMPREKAERIASEYGLKIIDFPEYAPEWVIFEANAPLDALEKIGGIRAENEVVSADVLIGRRPASMASLPNDPLAGQQWHLSRSNGSLTGTDINVLDAWKYFETGGVRGNGIKIGIIDSGIQTSHPDFVNGIDTDIDYDFVGRDDNPNPTFGEDHGTAVGGVAGARGNNGLGVSGAAPEATLVGHRLITGSFITPRQVADALAHRSDVIHIKNNSWGYTGPLFQTDQIIKSALEFAAVTGRDGKGTIFAFSAGNSGLGFPDFGYAGESANYSELTSSIYTIAVGAVSSTRKQLFYSEPGANLLITAPSGGVPGHPSDDGSLGITTTDRTGTAGYNDAAGSAGDYTDGFNGTSSSCPVISGVIALMLEKNPNLGWRDVQEILIRTAVKFNPDEPGWLTNAAGLSFNNDYGAGLVDATAAVNLAATWTNLKPHESVVAYRQNVALPVEEGPVGRTMSFTLPTSNLITEHVTLELDISHPERGELEITLTSPSGTTSVITERHFDPFPDFNDQIFSTVQNWGENSSGLWTMRIVNNADYGEGCVINNAKLIVYGVPAAPVNPAPVVEIISPSSGSVFSPGEGYTVNVDARDFDIDGAPGVVTKVDLFDRGILIGTDDTAPYSFPVNPANGSYVYTATATDSDGKSNTSFPVFVSVANKTPVISDVSLNFNGQAYDDETLSASVTASDPEGDDITLAYLWQFSTDETNYTDSAVTTADLPPNPDNSGKLWRCRITATDGNTTSPPFLTEPVNLLDRPLASAAPGIPYSYQSGLVLRGDDFTVGRQAIIHEFSQGPGGGTSEWIEILTLRSGSLANWSLSNSRGKLLRFSDTGVWDDIPAGTLIVIYNGSQTKDHLLPDNNVTPSSGSMVIASTHPTYFNTDTVWPGFSNLGESIFLVSPSAGNVHEISYGNSLAATPNVGQVLAGNAAYFGGETDAGADLGGEWVVTPGTASRITGFSFGTDTIGPGVLFTNGRYSQNFNTTPGSDGIDFPAGWSAYTVNIGETFTDNHDIMTVFRGSVTKGGAFNFGSKVGLFGTDRSFSPAFIALTLGNTENVTNLKITYDIEKTLEQGRSMDLNLQYTLGSPDNTGTIWTSLPGTAVNTASLDLRSPVRFIDVPLPEIFNDRSTPIYLRWFYRSGDFTTSSAGRDAFAIDNVIISSDQSPNIYLTPTLSPSSIAENAGANASVGTVTLNTPILKDLTVNLASSDTTEVTVPASITIPAGELSATFPIAAVDDKISDGPQVVTITLSATDFLSVETELTVLDDEPNIIGVTPGLPNNAGNRIFVDRLREGLASAPALFRLAAGSVLPDGLSLDESTGLISGTIAASATPGQYPVTIERTNVLGGFTSQKIVIDVTASSSFTYDSWVGFFPVGDNTLAADADLDELPNLLEYAMNTLPNQADRPSPVFFERSESEISVTYPKAKNRDDVVLVAEWSTSLDSDSWKQAGITTSMLADGAEVQTIKATLPIVSGDPTRFLRLRATRITPP